MDMSPQVIEVKQSDVSDIIRKSATRSDIPDNPRAGGIWHFLIPMLSATGGIDLPAFWTPARDWVLYQTLYREGQWANAVSKAITKMAAMDFEVEGEVPLKVRRAREMLVAFDLNRGWVSGLGKHLQAFILTGNGAFTEIVHQTGAPGSKVLGLVHLDTFRCIRTGDPEFPVIYRDRRGSEHVLKSHQVMALSDMPDQAELWNGVGHCAAERAFSSILRMEAIERYVYEKVSGKRPLAVHIVNVPKQQVADALTEAKSQRDAEGMVTYMGAVVMGMADPTATPTVATIPLASLPDGFVAGEERKNAYLIYANAIGIDPQMISPDLVSGKQLGSGAQARVIAEKQEVIGLAAWKKGFTHNISEYALDERTTFFFKEIDLTDQERKASITNVRATAVGALITAQAITPQQGLQVMVDWDELPEEFLAVDQTSDTTLTDERKPEGDASTGDMATALLTGQDTASQVTALLTGSVGAEPAVPGGVDQVLTEAAMGAIRKSIDKAIGTARKAGAKDALDSVAMQELLASVKALKESDATPQQIIVNVPEAKELPAPVVHVAAPIVNVPAPIVNVPAPIVNLPAPIVNVAAPIVQMPEYSTELVKDKEGKTTGVRHKWVRSNPERR